MGHYVINNNNGSAWGLTSYAGVANSFVGGVFLGPTYGRDSITVAGASGYNGNYGYAGCCSSNSTTYESFYNWNTSTVAGTITGARLQLLGSAGGVSSSQADVFEVYNYQPVGTSLPGTGIASSSGAATWNVGTIGNATSGTTISTTITPGTNGLVFVAANVKAGVNLTLSISDNQANTWAQANTYTDSTNHITTTVWYATSKNANAIVVTVTSNQTITSANIDSAYVPAANKPAGGWSIVQNAIGQFSGTSMTATFSAAPDEGHPVFVFSTFYETSSATGSTFTPPNDASRTQDIYFGTGGLPLLAMEVDGFNGGLNSSYTYTISPGTPIAYGTIMAFEINITNDWQTPDKLTSLFNSNKMVASFPTNIAGNWSTSGYNTLTSNGSNLTNTINQAGTTYLLYANKALRQNTSPTIMNPVLYQPSGQQLIIDTMGTSPQGSTLLSLGIG